MPANADFTVIDGVPRDKIANALQVQARSDVGEAIARTRVAFKGASSRVLTADTARLSEMRDAIASARLEINAACDAFGTAIADAERLFQAGVDLQSDDPEPPIEENAHA